MSLRRGMMMGLNLVTLQKLGAMELFWDFTAAQSSTDTDKANTIDTSGSYTSFARAFDFSGKGRHATAFDKASAPRVNGSAAQFLGAQYFQRLVDAGVNVGTILIVADGGNVTAASAFNIIGTFSLYAAGGTVPGFMSFGATTGLYAGETLFFNHSGSAAEASIAIANNLSGFNSFGITTPAASGDPLTKIVLNGVDTPIIRQPTTGSVGTLDLMLGRRTNPATSYFTGSIKKVLIYSNRMTLAQLQKAYTLLNT